MICGQLAELSERCLSSLRNSGKIIFAGNGGSFADSQHLAAELISRLQFDRAPLPSVALGTNSSSTTAIGNDYGYEYIFARELQVIGNENDVFIPISTSGNSKNILSAIDIATDKGLHVCGLTGEIGGQLATKCESIKIPSGRTERIQEGHILVGHVLCGLIEDGYFLKS
ncbi:MAG: SIS domain-containing protein [Actinobacteria bacterium]|nr:SIS domain-containing protein [Actinomycetota bacterium]